MAARNSRRSGRFRGLEPLEARCLLTLSFGPPVAIDGREFAAADVDGDARPDLAGLANGQVVIRRNLGNAQFAPAAAIDTGLASLDTFAFGDVTGDGKPDLVSADATNAKIAVLIGHGDGTFGSPSFTADADLVNTHGAGFPIALLDVNGDGKADLIAPNLTAQTSSDVFLSLGDGSFAPHLGAAPFVPTTYADFDGDGHVDLAGVGVNTETLQAEISIARGHGDGTFGTPTITNAPGGILGGPDISGRQFVGPGLATKPVDFNGDGRPDLVESDYEGGLSVLLNDGHGGFSSPITDNQVPGGESIAIADFDGDGHPDVVYAPSNAGTFGPFVLHGQANGTFDPETDPTGATNLHFRGIAAADFDGDGKPDYLDSAFNISGFVGTVLVLSGVHAAPVLSTDTVAVRPNPYSPTIPDQTVVVGSTLAFHLTAFDLDPRATFAFSSSLPGTVDPVSGNFSFTPNAVGTTTVTLTATVTNASPPLTDSQTIQITAKPPHPPTVILTPGPMFTGYANVPWTTFGLDLIGLGGLVRSTVDYGDGSGPMPLALNPSASSFTLAHTYTTPGRYTVQVTLTDQYGGVGTDSATMTVNPNGAGGGGGGGTGFGTPPVQVSSITTTVAKGVFTAFNVKFNGPVSNANRASNYHLLLVTARKVKKHVVTTTKAIGVKSVSVDSSGVAHVVPAGRVAPGKINELVISAVGIRDSQGQPIDGNGDGLPGGDLIADVRGKAVTIR